jgi:hypothetical protein
MVVLKFPFVSIAAVPDIIHESAYSSSSVRYTHGNKKFAFMFAAFAVLSQYAYFSISTASSCPIIIHIEPS